MIRLEECHIENTRGRITPDFDISEPITVAIRFHVLRESQFTRTFAYPQINICSSRNELLFSCMPPASQLDNFPPGSYVARCRLPADFLNNDTYYVSVGMASCKNGVNVYFYENDVLSFQNGQRIGQILYKTRNGFSGPIVGSIRPQLPWQIERVEAPLEGVTTAILA